MPIRVTTRKMLPKVLPMPRPISIAICAFVAGILVAAALLLGLNQVIYVELTKASLASSGRRASYFDRLTEAGALGKKRARDYALSWYRKSPAYGVFFVLSDRSLWRGYSSQEIRKMLGPPWRKGVGHDIWRVRDHLMPEFVVYLAVEYEDGMYARMGLPGSETPSDHYPQNAVYRLDGEYEVPPPFAVPDPPAGDADGGRSEPGP